MRLEAVVLAATWSTATSATPAPGLVWAAVPSNHDRPAWKGATRRARVAESLSLLPGTTTARRRKATEDLPHYSARRRRDGDAAAVSSRAESAGPVVHIPLLDWLTSTDLQWYCNITVGTPGQPMTVLLDTGSVDLILPSEACSSCRTAHKFNARLSSTYTSTGRRFAQGFDTGADTVPFSPNTPGVVVEQLGGGATEPVAYVSGLVASDSVQFATFNAGGNPNLLGAPVRQPFLVAANYPAVFGDLPFDGIMGMGLPGVTGLPGGNQGFVWNLYAAGRLANPVYALHLQSGRREGGQLTLGGTDPSRFDGDVRYVDVLAGQSSWTVNMGFAVDGHVALLSAGNDSDGASMAAYRYPSLFDTGTAFILTPSAALATMIYGRISPNITMIDPAGAWGAPCALMAQLDASMGTRHNLTFIVDDDTDDGNDTPLRGPGAGQGGGNASRKTISLTISPGGFNLGPYPGNPAMCQAVLVSAVSQGWPWIIGGPLLKQYYTIWDGGRRRVGFAKLRGS